MAKAMIPVVVALLARDMKMLKVVSGSTVAECLKVAKIDPEEHQRLRVNNKAAKLSTVVRANDIITMAYQVDGGRR